MDIKRDFLQEGYIMITENLTKSFKKKLAVDNLCISINKKQAYGLVGPNGAGKSTTLGMIATLIRPTLGDAFVEGYSIVTQERLVKQNIGFLPHSLEFPNPTPISNLILFSMLKGYTKNEAINISKEVIKKIGLEKYTETKVHQLSNGIKKLLGVAQAIMHNPPLLLLDEPFTGLDIKYKSIIRKIIIDQKKKSKIIISSHNLDEIEKICDVIGIINNGKLVLQDSVKKLRLRKNILTIVFDKIDNKTKVLFENIKGVKKVQKIQNTIQIQGKIDVFNKILHIIEKNDLKPISINRGNSIEEIYNEIESMK
jgi:sodium transport system ATP-binding protein